MSAEYERAHIMLITKKGPVEQIIRDMDDTTEHTYSKNSNSKLMKERIIALNLKLEEILFAHCNMIIH